MDFAIGVFSEFEIGGLTFKITETLVTTWIIAALLFIFAIIVRIKSAKWNAMDKPTGLQNFVEMCVGGFEGFFKSNAGTKLSYLSPWYFSLFVFLIFSNMIGVTPLRPPTADWGMTFPLAFTSFVFLQFAGFRYRPVNHIKGFFAPIFLFFPMNLLGELAKPVALSFRLFGNILGGLILMSLLYGIAPIAVQFLLPTFLHLYFDIAAGLLQAFIFVVLSLAFLGLAAED